MNKNSKHMVVEAAGGIVWRKTKAGKKLALVHRPHYDDWSLPKGKREKGESWQATALREVLEETGCKAKLESFAGSVSYIAQGIPKVVLFWNMKATHIPKHPANGEVDQVLWFTKEEALKKLTYQTDKTLLARLK